jgi:hypothetical protein
VARTVTLDVAGQAALARDLAAGGVLVPDVLEMGEDVELVLRGAGDEMRCAAKCVWVNGDKGSGLQLLNCDGEMKERIASLAADATRKSTPAIHAAGPDRVDGIDGLGGLDGQGGLDGLDGLDGPTQETNTEPTEESNAAPEDPDEADDDDNDAHEGNGDRKVALNVHERLRGLTLAQQIKIAGTGELSERIVLERLYGKNVWEPLLRNPRLTGPEVSRIARMGSLPRPLMEIILGNGAWLQTHGYRSRKCAARCSRTRAWARIRSRRSCASSRSTS